MFTVLVLDTNGLKEANLHLSEQQTDQLQVQAVLKNRTWHAIRETALRSKAGEGKASDQVRLAGPQTTDWLAQKSSGKKAEWQPKQQTDSLDKGRKAYVTEKAFPCVSAYLGICLMVLSKVSLTLELQHSQPNHKGRGKRKNSVLGRQQPHTEHLCKACFESREINQQVLHPPFENLPPSHSPEL